MHKKLNILLSVALAFVLGLGVAWSATGLQGGRIVDPQTNGFRLTLTAALPVTTADVTGATTIFCTPYKSSYIALYDGTATWQLFNSAEFSVALGTLTSGLPYDVFCSNVSNVPTLAAPLAWTNGTTRATALVRQDGVWCKTGVLTQRYMGTFYTTATTTTEDSVLKRYLFNASNRVRRQMVVQDATASWTYSSVTFRQARGQTTNLVQTVIGLSEDTVRARVSTMASNDTGQTSMQSGVGIDSNTVNSAQLFGRQATALGQFSSLTAFYEGFLGVGFHDVRWLEATSATGITTLYGANGTNSSGLTVEVMN